MIPRGLTWLAALFGFLALASAQAGKPDASANLRPNLSTRLDSYVLTAEDLAAFANPAKILESLDKQVGLLYPDTTALIRAIQTDLAANPDILPFIATNIRGNLPLKTTFQSGSR
jgi:hypothetical protein